MTERLPASSQTTILSLPVELRLLIYDACCPTDVIKVPEPRLWTYKRALWDETDLRVAVLGFESAVQLAQINQQIRDEASHYLFGTRTLMLSRMYRNSLSVIEGIPEFIKQTARNVCVLSYEIWWNTTPKADLTVHFPSMSVLEFSIAVDHIIVSELAGYCDYHWAVRPPRIERQRLMELPALAWISGYSGLLKFSVARNSICGKCHWHVERPKLIEELFHELRSIATQSQLGRQTLTDVEQM